MGTSWLPQAYTTVNGRSYRWDTNTLSWVPWDGTLTANGPITIGTVNQGDAGPEMWPVDASGAPISLAPFATRVDDTADPIVYVGSAAVGSSPSASVWQIKKLDTTNGVDILFADGNANYDNIWDNRASLSYS